MTNLEYLKKCRDKDGDIDYRRPNLYEEIGFHERQFRKMRALEIIAEQIINLDNTLTCVVTCLENVETAIKQGGLYP